MLEIMFQKIKNNKVLRCFLKFVLVTAILHIGVLVFKTIKEGNIKLLNYFSILDLNSFFPRITRGWWSDLISAVLMISIFVGFLIFNLNRKEKN
jgi:hypothetical protein